MFSQSLSFDSSIKLSTTLKDCRQSLRRSYRQDFTGTKAFSISELTVDSPPRLSIADTFCISQLSIVQLDCHRRAPQWLKIQLLHTGLSIIDSPIKLSTAPKNHLGQISNKTRFSLFKFIPKWVYFILLGFYQCFIDWFSALMMFTC